MSETTEQPLRWQIWVVARGDYLRTPAGVLRLFTTLEEAQQMAQEVGGLVQLEGTASPGGFDPALT